MIPKIEITDVGYIAPTTQEINDGLWQMVEAAFGGNVSRVQGTVQYQFVTSWTAMIKDAYDNLISLGNQFDPRYAEGIWQDAIAQLYFLTRKLATKSVCPVIFKGLTGAQIPEGFAVRDVAGRDWLTVGAYNIGVNGTVTSMHLSSCRSY